MTSPQFETRSIPDAGFLIDAERVDMITSPCNCSARLLRQSLCDELSEEQEDLLAGHLATCPTCLQQLEAMAADEAGWHFIESALREGQSRDESAEDSEFSHGDFVVEFLQPSAIPDSLGRLRDIEIRQVIGHGGHGIVVKGFQEELNRLVAVKLMAPQLASVAAARKRFAREARAAAAIVHPNVMPILLVDSSGQLPFLVMPYVDCESLQERLDRDGPFPLPDALRIGLQVSRALAAAHGQGLVHRDVKPANILLERGVERVLLTDFGLARAIDDATLTRSGVIAGTPQDMSPEQARGDVLDGRSDLFSLGSVLYAMGTGRPPFRSESTYGTLRRVTDEAPRSLQDLNSELPAWYEAIVFKLLSKSAMDRFQSADEVAELLEGCLGHLQQRDAFPLPMFAKKHSTAPFHRRSWSRWKAISGATVLSAVLVSFVVAVGLRNSPSPLDDSSRPQSAAAITSGALKEIPSAERSQRFDFGDDIHIEIQSLNVELDTFAADTQPDAPIPFIRRE